MPRGILLVTGVYPRVVSVESEQGSKGVIMPAHAKHIVTFSEHGCLDVEVCRAK